MKKSDVYKCAMRAIVTSNGLTVDNKLEVLSVLIKDKELSDFVESNMDEAKHVCKSFGLNEVENDG